MENLTLPLSDIQDGALIYQLCDLFLAVVEDKGDVDKKDENMHIDKKYYYQNDKLVREIKNDEENEYSIKESDAEELLAEFKENVEILKINK